MSLLLQIEVQELQDTLSVFRYNQFRKLMKYFRIKSEVWVILVTNISVSQKTVE